MDRKLVSNPLEWKVLLKKSRKKIKENLKYVKLWFQRNQKRWHLKYSLLDIKYKELVSNSTMFEVPYERFITSLYKVYNMSVTFREPNSLQRPFYLPNQYIRWWLKYVEHTLTLGYDMKNVFIRVYHGQWTTLKTVPKNR